MKLTQTGVSHLLGHKDSTLLCAYERGRMVPPLVTAFRLGLILRVPIEFLFPDLYEGLRKEVREKEEKNLRYGKPTASYH